MNNPLIYVDETGEFFHILIGATSGAMSGAVSGMVSGAGNAWINGSSFGQGLTKGLKGAFSGAIGGALIGGTVSGIQSVRHGGNFFTGKGYNQISELPSFTNDTDLGGDLASNKANLKTLQDGMNWSKGKYGVDGMSIEGGVSLQDPFTSYYRNNDGIINKTIGDGRSQRIRGYIEKSNNGILRTKTNMYLSYHKSLTGLKITLNHELIHAYHGALGLGFKSGYSEYSATANTVWYIPSYHTDLLKMSNYSDAFKRGYGWPQYLLP